MASETNNALAVVENPRNDQDKIAAIRRTLIDAQSAKVAEIEAATAGLTAENYKAEKKSKFDALEKDISGAGRALVDAVLHECGADAVTVQLAAYQTAVRSANKAFKAKWDEVNAASVPPAPKHTYFYAVTATDAQHVKLQKEIAGVDGGFGCVMPQKDAEWRTAAELFGIGKEG